MSMNVSSTNKISRAYSLANNLNAPNWDRIPHKGMKTPSKEELVQQIKDNATKLAQAKTVEEENALGYEHTKLQAQYLSSVSPDRKALYKDAMQVINQPKRSSIQKQPQPPKSIYDFLNERDGIESKSHDLANNPEPLISGGSVSASHVTGGGFDYSIQVGGNAVMASSGGNWVYSQTPQELEKSEEFNNIHHAAYVAARNNSSAKPKLSENSFEMRV